jgi:Sad1 / UNC-like C-terminal
MINLTPHGQKKNRANTICPSVLVSSMHLLCQFAIPVTFLPLQPEHLPLAGWLSTAVILLCIFIINHCGSSIVRSWEQHLACMLPLKTSQLILHTGRQCDWHQTAFSRLVPFGHDFASLTAGGTVSPRLTTLGIDSVPPSAVLSNMSGICWSFHGNSGTFGVAFDAPNVMPSHIVIHHRPSNSTASLSRAPRQVIVWGLVDGEANMRAFLQAQDSQHKFTSPLTKVTPPPPSSISKEGTFLPLANIDFDITAHSLRQAFPFSSNALSWGIDFGVIVLDIQSNWGADTTSLCSIHIYGHTVSY